MAAFDTLLTFGFPDGASPVGSLAEDAAGNLFGTAVGHPAGATSYTQIVFEVANTARGYAKAPTILATLQSSLSTSGLAVDAAGDLFAQTDGADGVSTNLYEIAKSGGGYAAAALLANVAGAPLSSYASAPSGSLVVDGAGNLFGATAPTSAGGDVGVYELTKSGAGYSSAATPLASIATPAGSALTGPVLAEDSSGDLFVGYSTGFAQAGVYIYEIAKTSTGYASTAQQIGSFNFSYGGLSSLFVDSAGNVFAGLGGYTSAIAEIAKTPSGYAASATYLDNGLPSAESGSLAEDSDGDLYVASRTSDMDGNGSGSIFEEVRADDGTYLRRALVSFDNTFGSPNGVLLGLGGDLYGTTSDGDGTLFRVDLQPPPVLTITAASVYLDSGALTVSGTIDQADAGLAVAIYDGDDFLGDATPDSGGRWSATFANVTPAGENALEAVATDAQGAAGSADATLFFDTNDVWGVTTGASGPVFLEAAQASITAGDAVVDLLGVDDAVSLYNTYAAWDAVTGVYDYVIVNQSQASVIGGGDHIDFAAQSGSAVSLYATKGVWDVVSDGQDIVTLVGAQASIIGGGEIVFLDGEADDAASLYATNGAWDTVNGDGGSVTLNAAQASVVGKGDTVYFAPGGGAQASLYDTQGVLDTIVGSNGIVVFKEAQAHIVGGANDLYFFGSDDFADLSATAGAWDILRATTAVVRLSGAEVSLIGANNQVQFANDAGNAASLYETDFTWDAVTGNDGAVTLNDAQTSVIGGGDIIYFAQGGNNAVGLYQTNGAPDSVVGSNGAISLNTAQASIAGDDDRLFLAGTSHVTLDGGHETIAFQAAIGLAVLDGFDASTDIVQFSSADFANWQALTPHISSSGADTIIAYDANDSVTLTNVAAASLSAANFKFV